MAKRGRRNSIAIWLTAAFFAAVSMTVTQQGEAQMTDPDEQEIRAAVDQWIVALNAMLNGDPEPLASIYSHADDTVYMGAEGTYRIGWDAIYGDWTAQAAASSGGEVAASDIHIVVSGNMAMASHITSGPVRQPNGEMNDNHVRETSVFRRENGTWLMIGHHADAIAYWEQAFGDNAD